MSSSTDQRPVRGIIGVDLDEVSAHYIDAIRSHLGNALGLDAAEALARYPEPTDYNFSTWPDLPGNFVKRHSEAVEQGLYRDLQPIDGAAETIRRLANEGFHIRVITSRFVKAGQHATVVADTAYWLDKNDIPYRDIMFVRHKPDVYADVYVDDSPSNIKAFKEVDRNHIIFDTSYNRDLEGRRAHTWDDVYNHIIDLFGAE